MNRAESRLALTHIAHLHTCDDWETVMQDATVLIEDGKILHVGKSGETDASGFPSISLAHHVVVPGLVNTHHHFFQHLTRSIPLVHRGRVLDWLGGLYPLWAELDAEMMYWAALAACSELLLSGCTTAADCSYLLPKTTAPSLRPRSKR